MFTVIMWDHSIGALAFQQNSHIIGLDLTKGAAKNNSGTEKGCSIEFPPT